MVFPNQVAVEVKEIDIEILDEDNDEKLPKKF